MKRMAIRIKGKRKETDNNEFRWVEREREKKNIETNTVTSKKKSEMH